MRMLNNLWFRIHCFMHPEENLKYIQNDIKIWADEAIPLRSFSGQLIHIRKEIDELEAEKDDQLKKAKELADIAIICLNLAGHEDIDLCDSVISKMKINKKRKWSLPGPDGVIHHLDLGIPDHE